MEMNHGDLVYGGSPRAGDILRIRGALDEVHRPLFWECPPSRGGVCNLFLWNVPHLAALPITKQEVNATMNLKYMHITRLRTKGVLLPTW
jgi:hypothetical protein